MTPHQSRTGRRSVGSPTTSNAAALCTSLPRAPHDHHTQPDSVHRALAAPIRLPPTPDLATTVTATLELPPEPLPRRPRLGHRACVTPTTLSPTSHSSDPRGRGRASYRRQSGRRLSPTCRIECFGS